MKPVLGIVARAPSSGGKSRLIGELGIDDGAGLRIALLRDTLDSVSSLPVDKAVLFTPAESEAEMRALTPFPAVFLPQRGATIGDRMRDGARDLLSTGFDGVVLIGSDLPTLPASHISAAFELLARERQTVVLGPAEDGGYYLIGLRQAPSELFDDIPWGTSVVLQRTLEAARAAGVRVEVVPTWYDVDSVEDLHRLPQAGGATRTRAWLNEYRRRRQLS